jgi:prepilin-type N-terminal cleavage/methylation domain-containing protein
MKKAFTLIELLVVIAIIAILAAMLMPTLTRARAEAQKALCQSNMHNIGLGWAMLFKDANDWTREKCSSVTWAPDSLASCLAEGYIDDYDLLVCPAFDAWYPRNPSFSSARDEPEIIETCYFADEARIKRESLPQRAIAADGIEMMTMHGAEPANHSDDNGRVVGSNVLFVDMAVEWADVYQEYQYWDMDQPETYGPGGYAAAQSGQDWTPHATGGTWRRWGWIQNRRLLNTALDTDIGGGAGLGEDDVDNGDVDGDDLPDDVDDIYYVDCTTEEFGDAAKYGFISFNRLNRCVYATDKNERDCAVAGGHVWWWRMRSDDYSGMTWGWPAEFKDIPIPAGPP